MAEEWPSGLVQFHFVTQFAVEKTHGIVLFGIRTTNANEGEPLQREFALTAERG